MQNGETATQAKATTSKKVDTKVGAKPVAPKSTMSSNVLFVAAKNKSIAKGQTDCMDIQVRNFNKIVSTQYSINWNPAELKFTALKDFKLKDLSENNFGKHIVDQGKLTLSWYDQNIRGINAPDDSPIFKLCFQAIGDKGKKSKVIFTQDPIAVEITGPNATFLKFSSEPGYVTIE